MANYTCRIRTNYFHVNDADAFREFMGTVYAGDTEGVSSVELFEGNDNTFAFGCTRGISGVRNAASDEDEDAEDSAYDEFIEGLQQHLADGDAIIITEVGYEKLCYLVGTVEVITKDQYKGLDLERQSFSLAQALLGNPEWTTKNSY